MKIFFCNGQPKSGSTFCFNLVKHLVPHLEMRTTSPIFQEAVSGNDEALRIIYQSHGEYTNYVHGSIATAASVFGDLPLPVDVQLIVKMHDATPAAAPTLGVPAVVLTTFRDPFDVMVALMDQVEREQAKPTDQVRPWFLVNDDPVKALTKAARFTAQLLASFTPSNWYLEYPAFIRPSPVDVTCLAAMLGVDEARVADAVQRLDRKVRAGAVYAEFNQGEPGRGRHVVEALVRSGRVPSALARDALACHRELVARIVQHGSGITMQ